MSDWKNVQYKDGKMRTNEGGGGGASALTDLSDVNVSNPSDGQVLKYDDATNKWVNANESGGGSGHTYSETEQVVGTWTDGKPLYEITVPITSFSYGSAFTVAHGISNLNKVVESKGRFYRGDEGSWNPIPFIYPGNPSSWGIQDYNYKSTVFSMFIGSSFSSSQISGMSITIRYTKTTD